MLGVQAQVPGAARPIGEGAVPVIDEGNAVVLEAVLDGHLLSDSLTAYQESDQFLLPLGELARLLTLAITVHAQEGQASGFVIREDRGFGLNVARALVNVNGHDQTFDARLVRVVGDDIYVAQSLLKQWLPIDFDVDLPTLQLRVKPRVKLPLQERLMRERSGTSASGRSAQARREAGYPRVQAPFALVRTPFIDQTFGSDARFGPDSKQYKAAYAAFVTTDVAGMEAGAYVSSTKDKPQPDVRWTLGRNDPDATLLGPLHARSVSVGHVVVPSVPNVLSSGAGGLGVMASNRDMGQPTNFDRHSVRGDLPPGWDVTLYYNDALVGYQPAGADGRYAFDDLPLSFGPNEFRLVFNGPLGQVRVERQSFLLDQSVIKPGEFYYAVARQHLDAGGDLDVAQFDLGLTRTLSANLGLVAKPAVGNAAAASFTQLGLRGYWAGLIANTQFTGAPGGGLLTDTSLKSRIGTYALAAQHVQRNSRFQSDLYQPGPDAMRYRDKVGVNGAYQGESMPPVSMAMEAIRDELESGTANVSMAGRLSSLIRGTAVSSNLHWQRALGKIGLDGSLQLSRRVIDIGLNGQLDFGMRPQTALRGVAVTADKLMGDGYRVNGGVLYSKLARSIQLSAGASKSFGGFAMAVSAGYSSRRELVMGVQVFMAMGRDPRSGAWFAEPQPLAGTGAVSVQAFVDKNLNGVRDSGEEAVPNAGFFINSGGRHPARTDPNGLAFIGRLQPGLYTDIAVDPSTLEDPQWKPSVPGVRVLPRPGLVQSVDFPVVYAAELEGTVYLVDKAGRRRGIGDARIELVDAQGQVQARTKSSPDGYYLLHQVMPGPATLRIEPEQARKLRLIGALSRTVTVPADGDFVSGQDFELQIFGGP